MNFRWILLMPWIAVLLVLGCAASKKMTVGSTAMLLEEVAKSSYRQSDLRVVRDGMPAYLMLIDGMVSAWPTNDRLLAAAAQSYSAYASAFAEDQDREYARDLYRKARDYALKALEVRGFKKPAESSFEEFEKRLSKRAAKDVDYLFWAAASWGNWISLSQGSMVAMAQLPKVEMMMKKVMALDEAFYHGGPHLFMGIWYASRPAIAGGDLNLAREHFLKARELGQGRFLMTDVYYAWHYARRALNRELYLSILQNVLETPVDRDVDLTLINTVAQKKARELLDQIDDYF